MMSTRSGTIEYLAECGHLQARPHVSEAGRSERGGMRAWIFAFAVESPDVNSVTS